MKDNKGKGGGSKHSTPPEEKDLYKARDVQGYCVAPEATKFRSGDGRKRGGPRKAKKISAPPRKRYSDDLVDLIERVGSEPVKVRDRTGRTETLSAIEVVYRRQMRDAMNGDAAAIKQVQKISEKAAEARDRFFENTVGKVLAFVADTHAGRHWKLNDFQREHFLDVVENYDDPNLSLMFFQALGVHDEAKDPVGYALRLQRLDARKRAEEQMRAAARKAAARAEEQSGPTASSKAAGAEGEPPPGPPRKATEDAGLAMCPGKDCAYLDAIRAPREPPVTPPEPPHEQAVANGASATSDDRSEISPEVIQRVRERARQRLCARNEK